MSVVVKSQAGTAKTVVDHAQAWEWQPERKWAQQIRLVGAALMSRMTGAGGGAGDDQDGKFATENRG